MKRRSAWALSGSTVALLVPLAARWIAGCGGGQCDSECPSGTIPDSTGCMCLQGGRSCAPNSPQPVQDGGAVLADCCPREVLQSTSRATPSGACTGRQQCFVAVHQVCAPDTPPTGGPLDEFTCTCDGANWQCSETSAGATICPPSDAGAD